jgi:HK97 family phage prohead protease
MRIEIRSDSVVLDGYVNAVGRMSRVLRSPKGEFREAIVPKTFERALSKGENVDLLFNHLPNRKLGSIAQGNLELREDNIGLRAIATVTDQEVIDKARAGDLRGWSFGMHVNKDNWSDGEDGVQKRMVEDIDLMEVSLLDKEPAYIATSVECRGENSVLTETRVEDFVASIEDRTATNEEDKQSSEKREIPVDLSVLDNEILLLQLKGRNYK